MAVLNPYINSDWENDHRIRSVCHEHTFGYDNFINAVDSLYFDFDVKHIAFSEYHHQDVPLDGRTFPEDYYGSAPYYPLDRYYDGELPSDLLGSPNSELTGGIGGHVLMVGSKARWIGNDFSRAEFDGGGDSSWRNAIWNVENEEPIFLTGSQLFEYIINGINDPNGEGEIGGFQFADAGGIYQAHSRNVSQIISRIDAYYPYWAGMGMYNDRRDSSDSSQFAQGRGYYLNEWNQVLETGRRCWAVAEIDRGILGFNVLMTKNHDEYDCLKAYREGNFYAQIANTDLKFVEIIDTGDSLQVEVENADTGIRIISENGVELETTDQSTEYIYPKKNGEVDHTFLRVEARGAVSSENPGGYADEIYSQPIMFRSRAQVEVIDRKNRIRKSFGAGLI